VHTPPIEHDAIRKVATRRDRLLTADALGVSGSAMARMEKEGVLHRVVPGVYVGAHHKRHPLIEAAGWTLRHPNAVACLLTAAVFYDLTEAFARGTWLFVPKSASVPRSRIAAVHVVQTASRLVDPDDDRTNGIVKLRVHGVDLRITGPDRTTLDLWRYPHKVSREYALDALRRRTRADDFHMAAFARLARRLRVWRSIEPIMQGLTLR